MLNIDNALKIEGWMNGSELLWLARQACTYKNILEVGSWKGRSTRALCDNAAGRVTSVDTFEGDGKDSAYDEAYMRGSGHIFAQFQHNLKDHIFDTKILTSLRMSSQAAFRLLNACNLRYDMIFIDCDHTYCSVKWDIENFIKLLEPEGSIICGHDIQFEDVRRAVGELLPNYQQALGTIIWYSER